TVSLWDAQGRNLGQVVIDHVEDNLVFGQFTRGLDYPQVERLFADYVEAANEQLLSLVGVLDREISALGLHLRSSDEAGLPAIYDAQIGDGIITFRLDTQAGECKLSARETAAGTAPPRPHSDRRTA